MSKHNGSFSKKALAFLNPLTTFIYPIWESAVGSALEYLKGKPFDPWVFADLTRYHACCLLAKAAMPEGIVFEKLPNSGLRFISGGCLVRVWRSDEGELRAPGSSTNRQTFFEQPFLPDLINPDPATSKFAIHWDYENGVLQLYLACPKNFDKDHPWQNGECHFNVLIPHPAESITENPALNAPVAERDDVKLEPKTQRKAEND